MRWFAPRWVAYRFKGRLETMQLIPADPDPAAISRAFLEKEVYNRGARHYIGVRFIGNRRLVPVFDSLDEQIKHDHEAETSRKERWLTWLAIGLLSILLFAGLYMSVRLLE